MISVEWRWYISGKQAPQPQPFEDINICEIEIEPEKVKIYYLRLTK
jgi:hypothetical protein